MYGVIRITSSVEYLTYMLPEKHPWMCRLTFGLTDGKVADFVGSASCGNHQANFLDFVWK